MPPDVKIRDLDRDVYDRLTLRARSNHRSVEAELRLIVADAVRSSSGAGDWEAAGFDEVHEIVPGRVYEVWVNSECYRIFITRSIVGSRPEWNSCIDHVLAKNPTASDENARRIWVQATDGPARHPAESAAFALRDAIMWLA